MSVSRQSTGSWKRQSGLNAEPLVLTDWAIYLDVDGVAVHSHGSFHHGLAERRVRMDVATQLPGGALEQLRQRGLGDELGGAGSHDVGAEQPAALRVADHLHETGRLSMDDRAPERGERELDDLELVAFLARLLLGESHRGDLR